MGVDIAPQTTKQWMSKIQRRIAALERRGKGVDLTESLLSLAGQVTVLEADVDALQAISPIQGVVPSSVQRTGGTATVAPDGTITFASVSTLSLNGIFDDLGVGVYCIFARMGGTSTGGIVTRFRNAGVDYAGSGYNYTAILTSNASGPARSSIFGTTSAGFWSPGTPAGPILSAEATVFSPKSNPFMRMESNIAASDRYLWTEHAEVSGSYDGLSVIATTGGLLTGRLKVVKVA